MPRTSKPRAKKAIDSTLLASAAVDPDAKKAYQALLFEIEDADSDAIHGWDRKYEVCVGRGSPHLCLAYVLRWAWQEHVIAAKKLGEEPTTRLVMLFDEIESHLHPRWQRSTLKSVLDAAGHLSSEMKIQFVLATHSPLVMASAEPLFDPSADVWFDLDLETSPGGSAEVVLRKRNFVRRGTAGRWPTSDAFNLESEGRSLEAEAAISAAERLLDRRRAGQAISETEVDDVAARLRARLPDLDGAWVRWSALVEELKGGPSPDGLSQHVRVAHRRDLREGGASKWRTS